MGTESKEDVIQNLKDAGCCGDMIRDFMECFEEKDVERQIAMLERHRSILLENVHCEERKISCLDYLLYQIHKNTA